MLPDPDTVARDSAYVIEDGTGQWLYFITGLGTEASPLIWDKVAFENGTTVLVNGNPVQTFDADSKLSYPDNFAISAYYRLFGLNTNSDKVRTFNIAITPNGCASGNIPRFNSPSTTYSGQNATGTFWVGTPVQEQHVANKKYVDEQVQAAKDASVAKNTTEEWIVYGTSGVGTQTSHKIATTNARRVSGSIPSYSSLTNTNADTIPANATLIVSTPTKVAHAANKKYVDDAIAAKPHITEQFKFMNPEDSSTNKLALSTYYAMDNTHITFEAIPLIASLPDAGLIFSTGSSTTVYRKIEFFKSSTVLESSAPWCRGTLVDGTVSYFQPASGGNLVAKSGPVLVSVTVSPITSLS